MLWYACLFSPIFGLRSVSTAFYFFLVSAIYFTLLILYFSSQLMIGHILYSKASGPMCFLGSSFKLQPVFQSALALTVYQALSVLPAYVWTFLSVRQVQMVMCVPLISKLSSWNCQVCHLPQFWLQLLANRYVSFPSVSYN